MKSLILTTVAVIVFIIIGFCCCDNLQRIDDLEETYDELESRCQRVVEEREKIKEKIESREYEGGEFYEDNHLQDAEL